MAIEQQWGKYVPVCDGCGCVLDAAEFDTFDEARVAMKEAGWSAGKDGSGGWVNFCPDCGE